jgi:hypothetical protein
VKILVQPCHCQCSLSTGIFLSQVFSVNLETLKDFVYLGIRRSGPLRLSVTWTTRELSVSGALLPLSKLRLYVLLVVLLKLLRNLDVLDFSICEKFDLVRK